MRPNGNAMTTFRESASATEETSRNEQCMAGCSKCVRHRRIGPSKQEHSAAYRHLLGSSLVCAAAGSVCTQATTWVVRPLDDALGVLIGFSPCRSEGGVHNLNFKLVDTACCQVCISHLATSDNTNCSLEEEKSIADLARRWQDRYNAPGTE